MFVCFSEHMTLSVCGRLLELSLSANPDADPRILRLFIHKHGVSAADGGLQSSLLCGFAQPYRTPQQLIDGSGARVHVVSCHFHHNQLSLENLHSFIFFKNYLQLWMLCAVGLWHVLV